MNPLFKKIFIVVGVGILLVLFAGVIFEVGSAAPAKAVDQKASSFHPDFILLDENGINVIESGAPISGMKTCGSCHDTEFIVSHSFHSDLGMTEYDESLNLDSGAGTFGKWDPINYGFLTQSIDQYLDLGTAAWLQRNGARLVGGGPGMESRFDGKDLTDPNSSRVDSYILDPASGEEIPWDWQASGLLEMDCFLCHIPQPNVVARTAAIQSGSFREASTATLIGSGIVTSEGNGFQYNNDAFDVSGNVKQSYLMIQDPTNENCAACHGEIHTSFREPFAIDACDTNMTLTSTTGQLISSQKINLSGMNFEDKQEQTRAWDIHAERALDCTDCHFSINNPIFSIETDGVYPSHLTYDPRKLGIGEYLQQPDHNFARGQSAQYNTAVDFKGTMRRCESCHNAEKEHEAFLPYAGQHFNAMACESCHIPKLYAPALEMVDWTFINSDGSAGKLCRGITGEGSTVTDLVTGFEPVLMQRSNIDGSHSLTPYNLVSSWYWVYTDENGNKRPIRESDLRKVFLQEDGYKPAIVELFDQSGDGYLQMEETRIGNPQQAEALATEFRALGLIDPRIEGRIQPYSINHNVTGEFAVRECNECHSETSRISSPMRLASYVPGGVRPYFVEDNNVKISGDLDVKGDGSLYYQPVNIRDMIYVFGKDRVALVDWIGAIALLGTVLGVAGHGTLRYFAYIRSDKKVIKTKSVYMYERYERFWHWLQASSIVMLVVTGLIIHRPDMFAAFDFKYVVIVHNSFAFILFANFLMSLFWHLVTGEIKQYIPRPAGFFEDMLTQVKFYISGIFRGEPHPFEKQRQVKLNPLQQVTYFGLLVVLLPLQMLTGLVMFAFQQWDGFAAIFGGLYYVSVFHTLVAWLLASFIVGHIYLTTTGATPIEAMKAMIIGWEEVEVHESDIQEERVESTEEKL